jgi:hypothetical protein
VAKFPLLSNRKELSHTMQELVINTVAASLDEYTQKEAKLIKEIQKPGASFEVTLPDDMDAEAFDVAVSAVSKVLVRAQLLGESMLPVLGRLLFIAQKNPDLWKDQHESFTAYRLSLADRFGVGKQTSYDALNYATRWGAALTPEEFKPIGRVKLAMLSKVIGKGKEAQVSTRKLLDFAKEHTAAELEKHLISKGLVEAGEQTSAHFPLACNKKQLKIYLKFFDDPRIHAAVGSSKYSDILETMVAECAIEWIAKGEHLLSQQAAEEGAETEAVAVAD